MFKKLYKQKGISPIIGVILLVAVVVALIALVSILVINIGTESSTDAADAAVDLSQTSNGISIQVLSNNNVDEFSVIGPEGQKLTTLSNVGDSVKINGIDGTYSVIALVDGEEQLLSQETIEDSGNFGLFVVEQNEDEEKVFAQLIDKFDGIEEYKIAVEFEDDDRELISNYFTNHEQLLTSQPNQLDVLTQENAFGLLNIKPEGSGKSIDIGDKAALHDKTNLCKGDEIHLLRYEDGRIISSETVDIDINCDDVRSVAEYDETGNFIEEMTLYNTWNEDAQYTAFGIGDNSIEAVDILNIEPNSANTIEFESEGVSSASSIPISGGSGGSAITTESGPDGLAGYSETPPSATTLSSQEEEPSESTFSPPEGREAIELSDGVIPFGESLFINAWVGTFEDEEQQDELEVYAIPIDGSTESIDLSEEQPRDSELIDISTDESTQVEFEFVFEEGEDETGEYAIFGRLDSNSEIEQSGIIEVIDRSFVDAEFEFIEPQADNPNNNTRFDVVDVSLDEDTFEIESNELLTVDLFRNGGIIDSEDTDGSDTIEFSDRVRNTGIAEYQVGIRQARHIQYVDVFSIGEDSTTSSTASLVTDLQVSNDDDECNEIEESQSSCHLESGDTVEFTVSDSLIDDVKVNEIEWIVDGDVVEEETGDFTDLSDVSEFSKKFDEPDRYTVQARLNGEKKEGESVEVVSDDALSVTVEPDADEFTASIEEATTREALVGIGDTVKTELELSTDRVIETEPVNVAFTAPERDDFVVQDAEAVDVPPEGLEFNRELDPVDFVPEESIESDRSVPVGVEVTEIDGDGELTDEFTIEVVQRGETYTVSSQEELDETLTDFIEPNDTLILEEKEDGDSYSKLTINEDNLKVKSEGVMVEQGITINSKDVELKNIELTSGSLEINNDATIKNVTSDFDEDSIEINDNAEATIIDSEFDGRGRNSDDNQIVTMSDGATLNTQSSTYEGSRHFVNNVENKEINLIDDENDIETSTVHNIINHIADEDSTLEFKSGNVIKDNSKIFERTNNVREFKINTEGLTVDSKDIEFIGGITINSENSELKNIEMNGPLKINNDATVDNVTADLGEDSIEINDNAEATIIDSEFDGDSGSSQSVDNEMVRINDDATLISESTEYDASSRTFVDSVGEATIELDENNINEIETDTFNIVNDIVEIDSTVILEDETFTVDSSDLFKATSGFGSFEIIKDDVSIEIDEEESFNTIDIEAEGVTVNGSSFDEGDTIEEDDI